MKQTSKSRGQSAWGRFLTVIGVLVVLGGIGYAVTQESTMNVDNSEAHATSTTIINEILEDDGEKNLLDEVRGQLDESNRMLDERETELIRQRDEIDAELEEIQEIRLSF